MKIATIDNNNIPCLMNTKNSSLDIIYTLVVTLTVSVLDAVIPLRRTFITFLLLKDKIYAQNIFS